MSVQLRDYLGKYIVTFCGRVYSYRFINRRVNRERSALKKIKPAIMPNRYLRVGISLNGKTFGLCVHQLVAIAFYGDRRKEGLIVGHKDGTRDNNHYKNLKWITYKENSQDARDHGTYTRGEMQGPSKLKDNQVREIYRLKGTSSTYKIAAIFNVDQKTVFNIWKGISWKHLNLLKEN